MILELPKLKKEMVSLTFDLMLKNLFEQNRWALKRFIISVLDLDISEEECDLRIRKSTLPLTTMEEYAKTVDFNIIINNDLIIDLEINREHFNQVKTRNFVYLNKIYSLSLSKGEDYHNLNNAKYIGLNLNAIDKTYLKGEECYVLYEKELKKVLIDNYVIILEYLDYYKRKYYNKDEVLSEKDYWLAALASSNINELEEILSKFLKPHEKLEFLRSVINLSNDDTILTEYEAESLAKLHKDEIYGQGVNEGRQQGIEKKEVEMIKSMLENKADYEFISNVTGKTIEEIKEIENR